MHGTSTDAATYNFDNENNQSVSTIMISLLLKIPTKISAIFVEMLGILDISVQQEILLAINVQRKDILPSV